MIAIEPGRLHVAKRCIDQHEAEPAEPIARRRKNEAGSDLLLSLILAPLIAIAAIALLGWVVRAIG